MSKKSRKEYLKEYSKRVKRVSVTLTLKEYKILEREAKKYGLKPTTFLKEAFFKCLDDEKFLSKTQEDELKNFVRAIRGIANNINQMAKHSNIFFAVLNKKRVFKNLEELEKLVMDFVMRK